MIRVTYQSAAYERGKVRRSHRRAAISAKRSFLLSC